MSETLLSVKLKNLCFTNGDSITDGVVLTTLKFPIANDTVYTDNSIKRQSFTFMKQDKLDINITLNELNTDTVPFENEDGYMIGHQIYNFVITPIR